MQKVLRKRVLRELKANFFRYMALGMLIILCMYLVVSLAGAAETVIVRVDELAQQNHLEDGEFTTFLPLAPEQEKELEELGAAVEPMFYLDFTADEDSVLRIFENRRSLNLTALDTGRLAQNMGEAVLEKRYAREHSLEVGDTVEIGGQELKVVGVGSVPDYDAPLKEVSDSSVDSERFGLAFVSGEQYRMLREQGGSVNSESYTYAYAQEEDTNEIAAYEADTHEVNAHEANAGDKEIKELLKSFTSYKDKSQRILTGFLPAADNPRIKASSDDQVINKMAGLMAGVVILALLSYVISVFTIHSIEKESSVIGALYALGASKKELLKHYLGLPLMVTAVSGIIGTCIGFSPWGIGIQLQECYDYFSVPRFSYVYPVYLALYGVLMPPVTAGIVNYFVMNQKLSCTALSLLRKEQKTGRIRELHLGNMGFMGRFRIRQMQREMRSTITVLLGMFISLLILLLGINCYVLCFHISTQNKEDTAYQYMYTCKFPDEEVPAGGEEAYGKAFKKENLGYELDVTLLGIHENNPYFPAPVKKGGDKIVLSSAAAQKFGCRAGDKVTFTDKEEDRDYTFTVDSTMQYSTALYAFMDIDSMRELFGKPEGYYNVVFSDNKLDIAPQRLYGVTSKEDIEKSSDIFVGRMMPLVYMMTGCAALILLVVMYLMMKVMIDRAAPGISLFKIFGFRNPELKRLYLNGNFYVIAAGAALCLPLAKRIMDKVYPMLVANVACAMDLSFSREMYLGIYGGILVVYFVVNMLLVRKVKSVKAAEVLKERE